MTITTAGIYNLLLPGLNAVFGDYDELPAQWQEIFSKNTSELYREIDIEVAMLPLASIRAEGAPVAYSDMGQRYQYVYIHKGVGVGFIMTKFAIRDNLYKQQFGPNTRALKHSLRQTKEVYGAAVLNNANDTTGTYYGGDSQPLLSTAHPIDTGTIANTPTTAIQINESTLQNAVIAIRRFKDAAGLRVMVTPQKVVIPPDQQFVTQRLLHTEGRVGTTDNDLNAIRTLASIPGGFKLNDYLTDLASWYVITDCPDGLKFFQRDPLEIDMYTDFDTDNLKVKGTERYAFGWSNFRSVYGSMP